jgi:integrase
VTLASSTGLRQGEAFGLTVPNVDFLRRRLEVVQRLVLVQGRPPFLGPPKTDASVRSIPLRQVAIDALAEHLAKYPAGEDQLVFTNEHGNPISRTRFSDPWQRAVRAAEVPRHRLPRAAALLREPAHPARRVGKGRPGPPRARERGRDSSAALSDVWNRSAQCRSRRVAKCTRSSSTATRIEPKSRIGRLSRSRVTPM